DPSWAIRTPGVRIKGARIEGVLDLTDCSGEGLPALSLVECEMPELVDLSHARLARVSFSNSVLSRLKAIQADVQGEVNITYVAPIADTLVINFDGARISGDLLLNGAKLARAVDSSEDAFNLQGAQVAGSVVLGEDFDAFGCLRLVEASVDGMLSATNATRLTRSEDAQSVALVADGGRCSRVVLRGMKGKGETRFFGAHVSGDLDIRGGSSFRNETGDPVVI